MITLLQLYFISLFAAFILFLIFYIKQKRFKKIRDTVWEAITDAIALNSGIIVLLYLAGKIFNIPYLSLIDDYALYVGLLIAGLVILGGSIDKLTKKRYKYEKRK